MIEIQKRDRKQKICLLKSFCHFIWCITEQNVVQKEIFLKEVRKRNEGESAQKRHSTKQMCTLVDRHRSSK